MGDSDPTETKNNTGYYKMDINEIIASGNSLTIAKAIVRLAEAYSDSISTDERPLPLRPWAKINGKFFVYSTEPSAVAELETLVRSYDTSVINLG